MKFFFGYPPIHPLWSIVFFARGFPIPNSPLRHPRYPHIITPLTPPLPFIFLPLDLSASTTPTYTPLWVVCLIVYATNPHCFCAILCFIYLRTLYQPPLSPHLLSLLIQFLDLRALAILSPLSAPVVPISPSLPYFFFLFRFDEDATTRRRFDS